MIRTVIIDDELKSRDTLAVLLTRYCNGITVEARAGSVVEGVAILQEIKPELVFLDISMPEGDGFELLEKVGDAHFEVIFVTAYSEYALRAIKASAIDYLLKPLNIHELQLAVQKAEERIFEKRGFYNIQALVSQLQIKQNSAENIAVPVNDGLQFIALDTIVRMEAHGSYTKIYCVDNTSMLSSKPLKDYEDLLQAKQFFRAHHSHIINISCIRRYHRGDGGYVTMNDGSTVDVSKRKKKEFLDLFHG